MVLAISTLIFISAFVLFIGQQRKTEFSQAMEDASSKMQSYVAQISSGTFSDIEGYSCQISPSTDRPVLTATAGSIGTNENCIALGKAIHVTPGDSKIYVYTVLGTRNQSNGETASRVEQANPEPALTGDMTNPDNWVLVEEYGLLSGATVLSSKIAGSNAPYNMVGIYNSLQADAPSSGGAATTLLMKAYPQPGDPKSSVTGVCIEEAAACQVIVPATTWKLCISDSEGGRTSELSISAKPSGVTTQLNDVVCS